MSELDMRSILWTILLSINDFPTNIPVPYGTVLSSTQKFEFIDPSSKASGSRSRVQDNMRNSQLVSIITGTTSLTTGTTTNIPNSSTLPPPPPPPPPDQTTS